MNLLIALISLPAMGFAAVILVPFAYAKWSARSLARWCRHAQALVLTYDDGPGEILTPQVLELLRRHQVKATFFALGRSASQSPGILDQVAAEGHELACHGNRHSHAWKVWPHEALHDIEQGYANLARWLPGTALFRPPHGKITLFTWLAMVKRKARIVWWTHDSCDTCAGALPEVDAVVDGIVKDGGGGVVLLHDFDRQGGGSSPRHEFVLSVTRRLIERAAASGLRILTFGQLLELRREPQPDPAKSAALTNIAQPP